MEIEQLRNNEGSVIQQPLSPPNMFNPSPSRGDKSTPATMDFGSHSGPVETNVGSEVQPTMDFTPAVGIFSSDLETPSTYSGERLGFENTRLSDIPELSNSAGVCCLSILLLWLLATEFIIAIQPATMHLPFKLSMLFILSCFIYFFAVII